MMLRIVHVTFDTRVVETSENVGLFFTFTSMTGVSTSGPAEKSIIMWSQHNTLTEMRSDSSETLVCEFMWC